MRRFFSTLVLPLVAAAFMLAAVAPATANVAKGDKRATVVKPQIKLVAPMRVGIGQKLVIRGRNFRSGAKRNTVLFVRVGKTKKATRVAFAKPLRATKRKLVVRVPAGVTRLLKVSKSSTNPLPTRVKLRVVSARGSGALTGPRLSPLVVKACGRGRDHDGDLLSNADELRYGMDPCSADTDGDGLSDGWEYYSAKDLNLKAVPYPGKRRYPNPLCGPQVKLEAACDDSNIDFDGDSLSATVEYKLWRYTGSSFDRRLVGNHAPGSPLGYSDGSQASRPYEAPAPPSFRTPAYGYPFSPPSYPGRNVMPHAGMYRESTWFVLHSEIWTDDERDADADGLNNYVETSGPGRFSWWRGYLTEQSVSSWPGTYNGLFERRPFADLAPDDPDVDGDGLLDGEDDQDNDDVLNFDEMHDVDVPFGPDGGAKNAFNPCAPNPDSRTCPIYRPFQ